ncbi:hypothetical protein Vafri_4632 [Volvox africanus]|nr:hypothetical protein Vafri_4632 [Volvox africanus]
MAPSALAVVVSSFRALLTAAVLTTLLSPQLGQCCYSESYSWDESRNPRGPSRCRSSNKSCDCDGLRTCSFWGYCQGAARASSMDSASKGLATATPPLSTQLGSSLEESHNDSGGGGGIGSDGIRRLIIIPIAIFGTVFGLGGFILLLCFCCNRHSSSSGAPIQEPSRSYMLGLKQQEQQQKQQQEQEQEQQQQLRKDSLQEMGCSAPALPPLPLQRQSPKFINPVHPSSVTVECSSSNGDPISTMADVGTTDRGGSSNGCGNSDGGGLMKLRGSRHHRVGGPEPPVLTPPTANNILVIEAPGTAAEPWETQIHVAPHNIQ